MHKSLRWICLAALLAPFAAAAQAPHDLAGDWRGTWTKNGDPLAVTVHIARDAAGYSGAFSSDALQVSDIPFTAVSREGEHVHIVLKGDATTSVFDGTLGDGRIAGTFLDGPDAGQFVLDRSAAPEPVLRSREVQFQNGDVTLSGTLILPADAGRHRAILFLQGSGPEGRWANRYLAQKLARAGIAALIYDKRGVGQSGGDWTTAGFDTLAGDAAAGVRFLRQAAGVDPARVGVYGHSQGGTIAPMVAVRSGGLGFVVASAPAGLDPAQTEIYSVGNSIGLDTLAPAERADAARYVRAIVDVAYRGAPRAGLDLLAARFKSRPWYFDPPPPGNSYWGLSRRIASYRPAFWWRQVKAPVLLLFGAKDERVPPMASLKAIRAALRAGGNRAVTPRIYPGADHTFTLTGGRGWPRHVAGYADTIAAWILSQR